MRLSLQKCLSLYSEAAPAKPRVCSSQVTRALEPENRLSLPQEQKQKWADAWQVAETTYAGLPKLNGFCGKFRIAQTIGLRRVRRVLK